MVKTQTLVKLKVSPVVKASLLFTFGVGLVLWVRSRGLVSPPVLPPSLPISPSPVEEETPPPFKYEYTDQQLTLREDGLPEGWEYSVPLFKPFTTLGSFQVGQTEGIYLGTSGTYQEVGRFYQTLADREPEWELASSFEEEGDQYLVYGYINLEVLAVQIVVYRGPRDKHETTYSVSVSPSS